MSFTDRDRELLTAVAGSLFTIKEGSSLAVKKELDQILAATKGGVPPADLSALTAKVDAMAATLAKIENALKSA